MPTTQHGADLAVLMVGLLPRPDSKRHDDGCARSLNALGSRVLPSLASRVLLPTVRRATGAAAHVYGHTWGCGRSSISPQTPNRTSLLRQMRYAIRELPRVALRSVEVTAVPPPATISVPISRATGAFYFLLSIKRGLLLMGDSDATRFTLIMRWDVVWYSDFRVSDLDPLTLYRANWCRAVGPWLGNQCRGLRPFKSPALTCSDAEGVPDFYLAGRASTLTSALADGADAYVAGTIPPKRCPALHGVLAGLLQRSNVTLGRYLVHQMDYDFVREPREGRRFDDRERASTDAAPLWRNADDWRPWREAQAASVCPSDLYFCDCEAKPLAPVACTMLS